MRAILCFALALVVGLNACSSDYDPSAESSYYTDSTFTRIDSIALGRPDLPRLINYANFDSTTISMFHTLAEGTEGKLYMYESMEEIVGTVTEIIENQLADNADLCFLIDKTGSMYDDIIMLQSGMNAIFELIEKYENVNVALALYGDKNVDGRNWLEYYDFTTDYPKLKKRFKRIKYAGGGDAPESLSDAAAKMVETLSWSSTSKRALLILGDAPSLLPPKAKHSIEDLVLQAKAKDIVFNYYPVVVGMQGALPGPRKEALIATMYPVPASALLNLVFEQEEPYKIEIFNLEAQLIQALETDRQKVQVDVTGFENGTYILRVYKPNGAVVDSRKFMVEK